MAEEEWAPIPKIRPAGCPVGLECLISLDQVVIGFGQDQKHSVNNSRGQKLFFVSDCSGCCLRYFCCTCRPAKMELLDYYGNELINFRRSCSCCPSCCPPELKVYAPPDTCVGVVKQTSSLVRKSYSVHGDEGQRLLAVKGPACCCYSGPEEYEVLSAPEGALIGRMSKAWVDLDRILFGNQKLVGISFPPDLDVRLKTSLIGACFLAYKKC